MYVETVIVIIPVKVIVERTSDEICPKETPNARIMSENSEICPRAVPTKKFVLFV